ncbi:hypothetical protein, partial [Capnocytophaga ochracea]|uniref:hypothetical protein n=1 Tax=Capnocytophaga ochracea TaxID=1018 RepID=UPI002B48906B
MLNDCDIENLCFELAIKSTNINKNDFVLTTAFNFSHNRSEVLKINDVKPRFQYIRPHGYYDEKEYMML